MNLRRQRSRLLWLLMLSPLTGFGQIYVDGVAIDTLNTPFCQLICTNPTLLSRTWVQIDYGQRYVSSGLNRQKIAGADREPITFNSTIDALNFMSRNGWELVSSQVTANDSGSERSFIYLLRRRKQTE